ncbi:hypothetical protein [Devosia riboflavina]
MKMDRRLTNGLAWAGALLVIGIPAADYLTGAFAGTPSVAVIDAAPVPANTAAAAPSAAPTPVVADASKGAPTPAERPQAVASASDPVSAFQQSGKTLPSYITGGGSPATAAPAKPVAQSATTPAVQQPTQAVTTPAPVAATPAPVEQVAALPAKAAPMPMPLSMRPQPVSVPLASNQPLIIDQPTAAPIVPVQQQPNDLVTAEDLEDWEAGPLNEFLARRGQQSSATYRVQQNNAPAYDSDGFWLDQGPRNQRYPQSNDDVYYTPF